MINIIIVKLINNNKINVELMKNLIAEKKRGNKI